MAQIAKKTKRYPSDLTDEEWDQIAPLMPKPGRRGRPREVDFREVINAVRYLVRSGCGWRMLPIHFGPWQTVYGWFRELARRFLFQTIHDVALMLDREQAGREASPSAGVIDSQSVKAPAPYAERGYDAGKKIVGRKRHITVDTDGRLLMVNLTPADMSDSAGAQAILDGLAREKWRDFLIALDATGGPDEQTRETDIHRRVQAGGSAADRNQRSNERPGSRRFGTWPFDPDTLEAAIPGSGSAGRSARGYGEGTGTAAQGERAPAPRA
jgi:transposase